MAGAGALDYYYGVEAEQYTFYRIPKVLFTAPGFRQTSSDAKILYGLMLDRMGLSMRSGWLDEVGRVFIYFTLEEAMTAMGCGHTKAVALFTELDKAGLIERKKQGQGRPTKIYVKNFVRKAEVLTSEKRKSALPETGSQDFRKTDTINTDISNTDRSNTDLINLSDSSEQQSMDLMEEMKLFQMNTALVKRNIEYDCLVQRCRLGEQQQLDEIVALIVETISIERENITISGVKYPYQFVKSRLLLLEESHIEYVLDCLHENTREVKNIKAYLLTCLMNSITTIGNYYQAKVNHDMYGGGI